MSVQYQRDSQRLEGKVVASSVLSLPSVNSSDTGPYVCTVTCMDKTTAVSTQLVVHGEHMQASITATRFSVPILICLGG